MLKFKKKGYTEDTLNNFTEVGRAFDSFCQRGGVGGQNLMVEVHL